MPANDLLSSVVAQEAYDQLARLRKDLAAYVKEMTEASKLSVGAGGKLEDSSKFSDVAKNSKAMADANKLSTASFKALSASIVEAKDFIIQLNGQSEKHIRVAVGIAEVKLKEAQARKANAEAAKIEGQATTTAAEKSAAAAERAALAAQKSEVKQVESATKAAEAKQGASDRATAKQIKDGERRAAAMDQDIKKENALADRAWQKQLKVGEARAAAMDAEIQKEATLRQKQEAFGLQYIDNLKKQEEALKVKADAADVKLKKEQEAYSVLSKQYNEAAKDAQNLAAKKALLENEKATGYGGQVNNTEIARLTPLITAAEAKAKGLADQLLKIDQAVGKSQRNVGNYNGALMAMSQILREAPSFAYSFATGLLGISNNIPILVDEIQRLNEVNRQTVAAGGKATSVWKILGQSLFSISGIITIATAAITILAARMDIFGEKTNEATDAANTFAKSLSDVAGEMSKVKEEQEILNKTAISNAQQLKDIQDNTVEGLKEKEKLIRSIGVVNGNVYEHEKELMNAANATRDAEIKRLSDKKDAILGINAALNAYQGSGKQFGQDSKGEFGNFLLRAGVSPDKARDLDKEYDKAIKKGINPDKILNSLRDKLSLESEKIKGDIKIKENEISNAIAEFVENRNRKEYEADKELQKELADSREQYRQVTEAEDIASVDKIVRDTKAKYALMAADIRRNRETYRLSVTTPEDVNYVDKNIKAYDQLLKVLGAVNAQEQKNAIFELHRSQFFAQEQARLKEVQSGAAGATSDAAFGIPDYNRLSAAQDKQLEAKKEALRYEFQVLAEQYRQGGLSTAAIEKQFNDDMIRADRDAYTERLKLAEDYLTKITDKINTATNSLLSENSRRHFNAMTSIATTGGHKEYRRFIEEQANIRAEANIQLQGVNQQIPAAQEAFNKSVNAASGPLSPDYKEQAEKAVASNKETLEKLLAQRAEYENKIAESDEALKKKKVANLEAVADAALQLEQEIINAAKQRYQAEIDQLEEKRRISDENYNAEVKAIERTMQSDQKKAAALGALDDRKRARDEQIHNREIQLKRKMAAADKIAALSGAIAAGAKAVNVAMTAGPYIGQVLAVITAAAAAIQVATILATPLPQYGDGVKSHPGGGAVLGDKWERERVKEPGKAPYWSNPYPTVYDLKPGTEVVPERLIPPAELIAGSLGFMTPHLMGGLNITNTNDYSSLQRTIVQENKATREAIINKRETHFNWNNGQLVKSVKNGNNWTAYLDKNFKN